MSADRARADRAARAEGRARAVAVAAHHGITPPGSSTSAQPRLGSCRWRRSSRAWMTRCFRMMSLGLALRLGGAVT